MKLTILLTLGFRNTYEKAGHWLRKTPWDSLFLSFPMEAEPYIKAYAKKRIDETELWRDYTLLTGLSDPFINSLRSRFQPVLNNLRVIYTDEKEIHCYQDLKSHIKEKNFIEKILLLEFRYKITGKLDLKIWKKILSQEMKHLKDSWSKASDRILAEAEKKIENIVLLEGSLKSIKHLKKENNKVEIILLENYWKSPLDILRTIIWKHGFENISDEKIEEFLNLQDRYLDLIINFDNADKAHREWSRISQKKYTLNHLSHRKY